MIKIIRKSCIIVSLNIFTYVKPCRCGKEKLTALRRNVIEDNNKGMFTIKLWQVSSGREVEKKRYFGCFYG